MPKKQTSKKKLLIALVGILVILLAGIFYWNWTEGQTNLFRFFFHENKQVEDMMEEKENMRNEEKSDEMRTESMESEDGERETENVGPIGSGW